MTDGSEELGRKRNYHKCYENTRLYGDSSRIIDLPSWDAAISKFPVLASDPAHKENKTAFEGIYNGNAGWVKPLDAMSVIKRECEGLGVQFVSGLNGTVVQLLRASDEKTVVGIQTKDGTKWHADKIIIAAGSYSDTLLDFQGQLEAVRRDSPIFCL
jgi:sarcosine oxidase/L-pipecolate oxidase